MPAHEEHQSATNVLGEQRHGDCGDDSPDDECMPLPLPDLVNEPPGMMAEMLHLFEIHGEPAGMKEMHAELNERQDQKQVERRHRMGTELRRHMVQSEDPREGYDHDGGEAHGRIDSYHHSKRKAPSQPPWSYAAAQQTQERT